MTSKVRVWLASGMDNEATTHKAQTPVAAVVLWSHRLVGPFLALSKCCLVSTSSTAAASDRPFALAMSSGVRPPGFGLRCEGGAEVR